MASAVAWVSTSATTLALTSVFVGSGPPCTRGRPGVRANGVAGPGAAGSPGVAGIHVIGPSARAAPGQRDLSVAAQRAPRGRFAIALPSNPESSVADSWSPTVVAASSSLVVGSS